MARYPRGKGGAPTLLCAGSSPARAFKSRIQLRVLCKASGNPILLRAGTALSHTTKDLKQQLARIRRIRGQVEAIERALRGEGDSEQILQLVASCRGALNGLMAVLIEGHLRFHVLPPSGRADSGQLEAAEELVAVVKRYFQ